MSFRVEITQFLSGLRNIEKIWYFIYFISHTGIKSSQINLFKILELVELPFVDLGDEELGLRHGFFSVLQENGADVSFNDVSYGLLTVLFKKLAHFK
jgi:hypothetical protein